MPLEDERLGKLLDRAFGLARSELEGIDDAARELAGVAEGDVALMADAIRWVRSRVDDGGDRELKQVASLLRRSLEIGQWDWDAYEGRPAPR